MLNIGETFPNFAANTTMGEMDIYSYMCDSWSILFSHPSDFTPVCTTEISRLAQLSEQFDKRNVKVLIISCDTVDDHKLWLKDVSDYGKCDVKFPLIGDESGVIAKLLGMLDLGYDNKMVTARAVFVIGPDKKVKAVISYPASTGRNFDEIIRLIDSLQLTASRADIVTPADWKVGDSVLVRPGQQVDGSIPVSVSSGKTYLNIVEPEVLNK